MVALRLFVPESWTSNPVRLTRAGVPVEHRAARTKPEIALAEIDRVMVAGMRFGCVLADAGYGLSAPFRQGLTTRGLAWAVGIPRHQKVYPVEGKVIWPADLIGQLRHNRSLQKRQIVSAEVASSGKLRSIASVRRSRA